MAVSRSGHRKPGGPARIRTLEHPALDQPSPRVVGDEGDALNRFADDQRVQPIRFPAVIEPVEQAEMMPVQMQQVGAGPGVVSRGSLNAHG